MTKKMLLTTLLPKRQAIIVVENGCQNLAVWKATTGKQFCRIVEEGSMVG